MITCELRRRLAVCLIATATLLPCRGAVAQDEAAARALFDEARRLKGRGEYDKACPKFEAATKLYGGSGLLLNLGDCYEHLGRTASAWTTFGEAASTAARLGRADDEKEAKKRQTALEAR